MSGWDDPVFGIRSVSWQRSVTRSTRRWAVSPLDLCVHLMPEGGPSWGVLTARCGRQLPTAVNQHDQPPPGPPCEPCRLTFLADFVDRDNTHPPGASPGEVPGGQLG